MPLTFVVVGAKTSMSQRRHYLGVAGPAAFPGATNVGIAAGPRGLGGLRRPCSARETSKLVLRAQRGNLGSPNSRRPYSLTKPKLFEVSRPDERVQHVHEMVGLVAW